MPAEQIPSADAIMTARKILTVMNGREFTPREAFEMIYDALPGIDSIEGEIKEERVKFMSPPKSSRFPGLAKLYSKVRSL